MKRRKSSFEMTDDSETVICKMTDGNEADEVQHSNEFIAKVTVTVIAVSIVGFALILWVCRPPYG